jgi:hypothetical protein
MAKSPVANGECAAIVGATRHHRLFHALDARHIDRLSVMPDFTADATHGLIPYQMLVQRLRNDSQQKNREKYCAKPTCQICKTSLLSFQDGHPGTASPTDFLFVIFIFQSCSSEVRNAENFQLPKIVAPKHIEVIPTDN